MSNFVDRIWFEPISPFKSIAGSDGLYIEGTPVMEVNGGLVTVTIPRLINPIDREYSQSRAWGEGAWLIHQANAPRRYNEIDIHSHHGSVVFNLSPDELTIPAESASDNVTFSGSWVQPHASLPYTILSIYGLHINPDIGRSREIIEIGGSGRYWMILAARDGHEIPENDDFKADKIVDYIVDSDSDGVSDYNEGLMGTDPEDPGVKPPPPIIYLYAVHTAAYARAYSNDPLTGFTHRLEYANKALRISGVNFSFQPAAFQLTDYVESDDPLTDLERETGVFKGIRAEAEGRGGDILVFLTWRSRGSVCGEAGLLNTNNAFIGRLGRANALALVTPRCSDDTLAHELGHTLGLCHDAREVNCPTGIFRWSRGHGMDGNFHTIMAYRSSYEFTGIFGEPQSVGYFSNPDLLRSCNGLPCGIAGDLPLGANAALSLNAISYQASMWADPPPDDDRDGLINFLDPFPEDADKTFDTDGDGIHDHLDNDDDNDGLTDAEEAVLRTNPRKADSDGDGANDPDDAFPNDEAESVDADGDGVPVSVDANDNDAGITWTFRPRERPSFTLTPDATVTANLIATFDDATDDPAAIRANPDKYEVTGIFADPSLDVWERNRNFGNPELVRVGDSALDTRFLVAGGVYGSRAVGTLKIKDVAIRGRYLNFLSAIGPGDIGIDLYSADTSTLLLRYQKNGCRDRIEGNHNWVHFDVTALVGQVIDILIYDNDDSGWCRSIALDHLYQSDNARGRLLQTAVDPLDNDGDGTPDARDAFPQDSAEWLDTDGDGTGNNADRDDDDDGYPDTSDAFPLDAAEWLDSDGDGLGNNADPDDDNDGARDARDAFPLDPGETADSDSDGLGDNREAALGTNPNLADSDSDNVNDGADAFPLDPAEAADSDLDGIGDNRDAAPHNDAIAYICHNCKTDQALHPDAVNADNVIADLDDPLAIQRGSSLNKPNGARYSLTGIFTDPALAARGWNFFETQDEAARQRRRQQGSGN